MIFGPEKLERLIEESNINHLHDVGGIKHIAKSIESSPTRGICELSSIEIRKQQYGSNEVKEMEIPSLFEMLLEALGDQTLLILIGCAVLSLILEVVFSSPEERSTAWIDGGAILMAVSIVSVIQATSNHKQEIQFASINRNKSIFKSKVIRNGVQEMLSNTEIVVGDLVSLEQGDKVPADGIVVISEDMMLNMSSTTGESETISKGPHDPFMIGGTVVCEGRGTFMVLAVGEHSQYGKIFSTLNEKQGQTPLQIKLEDLATQIGYAGMIVAALTFIVLFICWVFRHFKTGWNFSAVKEILEYVVGALTIVVVAVPEGLPLAVTISLAYSMRRMMSDNNFVRRLSACETMGSATVICTDKTGTLTQNQMNVERIIVGFDNLSLKEQPFFVLNEEIRELIAEAISINTTAVLSITGDMGSQTECAVLRMLQANNIDYLGRRQSKSIKMHYHFSDLRKTMSTIISKNNHHYVYVKGASEVVLSKCTKYLNQSGRESQMDSKSSQQITELIHQNESNAYRCLAIAYKEMQSMPQNQDEAESGLILVGIIAIRDSLRPSTKNAIMRCQGAGIRVIMVTGDSIQTAKAIGRECGILTQETEDCLLTGSDIRKMSQQQLIESLKTTSIVARSNPNDKTLIVAALQASGEIVAVTGDGTNDASALRKADIGLSMGKSGTELAKEASDIVILDDDFKSIVSSVMWGRCIFNNVRRFLQFQLTANVVTLFISFISSVVLKETPFKAVQLLWVNLIMDSLGALALATGNPHPTILNRPVLGRSAPLISDLMITNIGGQALFQIIVVALLLYFHDGIESCSVHHYTLLFNVFVFCQVFNLANARVVDSSDSVSTGFCENPLFISIMFGISIVQFILIQFCGKFFSTVPLSVSEWVFSIAVGSFCVPWGILVRCSNTKIFIGIVNVVSSLISSIVGEEKKEKVE